MAVTNLNSDQASITVGNVTLVDPNKVNVNLNVVNGIPQYQDMYIFAELTATKKGRTVLVTGANGITNNNTSDKSVVVNFMGNDQNPDSPNYLKFTTNWYDGSVGNNTQYEGFGISNIKVVVNSSFVPQINIQFIDLRGLAFFNQSNSPYRILFDFPPPVFQLTLKGYYGKALSYKLHLVKYTSEFRAENGNYIIDAQFIAITYAPLTDILFRYAVNFPLINNDSVSISSNTGLEPKNTYELILKLKNLYSEFSEKKNTSTDNQTYENILKQISNIDDAISLLGAYNNDEDLKKNSVPVLMMKNSQFITEGGDELTTIKNLSEYDNYIKSLSKDGIPDNLDQRLYITYLVSNNVSIPNDLLGISEGGSTDYRTNILIEALDTYRKNKLIAKTNNVLGKTINDNDIPLASEFRSNTKNNTSDPEITNLYVGLDVTNFYIKLYKQKANLLKLKSDTMSVINQKINNMVIGSLGMKPTIYNIFKIILNDVDTFFNILRTTSNKAENDHHVKYANLIANSNTYKDIISKIYAFPLIIKQEMICNQIKESRIAPVELSASLPEVFPELDLIKNFIDTFTTQQKITELVNMRAEQNADGTYKWIPISPVDSKLATSDLNTPYYGVDTSAGGNASQPINLSSDSKLTQIFKILLNRFYILSQSSLTNDFYNTGRGSETLISMFSASESINLAASITNTNNTKLLSNAAEQFGGNVNNFYNYIKTNIPDYYSFTQDSKESIKISNGSDIYVDKKNKNYQGFILSSEQIVIQSNEGGNSNNPIDKFQKDNNLGFWDKLLNGASRESFYKFTQENVFYIKDSNPDGSDGNNNVNVQTRFASINSGSHLIEGVKTYVGVDINVDTYTKDRIRLSNIFAEVNVFKNRIDDINFLSKNGNNGFREIGITSEVQANGLILFGDIINIWVSQLSNFDTQIYDTIINVDSSKFNSRLSALIILSNFGYTLSPFNIFPFELNKLIFNIPAAIEIPSYLAPYMGALVDIKAGDNNYNDIYNFFVNGSGRNLDTSGVFIFADIFDINNYLSANDKKTFQDSFNTFYRNGESNTPFRNILSFLNLIYLEAQKNKTIKKDVYQNGLDPTKNGKYFNTILQPLLMRNNIINFSQITFERSIDNNIGYESISVVNDGAANKNVDFVNKKNVNDKFFKSFFRNLSVDIKSKENELTNKEQENKKLSGDDDITTQMYYSFKNINDKWLTGPLNNNSGYPFNDNVNKNLIDSFVFVDRAMNPVGDTVINPEILVNMLDDPNISVFTVLTQLLSNNGFEFFPLQNFMDIDNNDWENSFKIDTSGIVNQAPTFVCMYIGGSSSYPSDIESSGNEFKNDGILDLSNPGVNDFSTEGCQQNPSEDNQTQQNNNFQYRKVRAFRVRFGEQNQSMFTNIKIDSKEYPETNESIQILSRLAGDNKLNAPPPKGQNLYNLYENRSYKATVNGLGNMMIQPTQYFQLENAPMYNGAYIILGVEHFVEPNRMTTSFYGTKILKYPVPRVKQASAILGFEGGNSDQTDANTSTDINPAANADTNPAQTQYNSMYSFKIQ